MLSKLRIRRNINSDRLTVTHAGRLPPSSLCRNPHSSIQNGIRPAISEATTKQRRKQALSSPYRQNHDEESLQKDRQGVSLRLLSASLLDNRVGTGFTWSAPYAHAQYIEFRPRELSYSSPLANFLGTFSFSEQSQ